MIIHATPFVSLKICKVDSFKYSSQNTSHQWKPLFTDLYSQISFLEFLILQLSGMRSNVCKKANDLLVTISIAIAEALISYWDGDLIQGDHLGRTLSINVM